jgi:hypothetical protein
MRGGSCAGSTRRIESPPAVQAKALEIAPLPNAIVIVEEAADVVGRITMLRLYAREQRLACRSNRTGAAARARNGRRPARQVRP